MIWSIIGLVVGAAIGSAWREIYHIKDLLKKPKEEPKRSGVAGGAYTPISETKQSMTVVRPKTPQQKEWIATDKQRREAI